jgi:hypothetical protein
MDLSEKRKAELENLIANHRQRGATSVPLYLEAMAELARRNGQGLSFEKSLSVILAAARLGRFVTYKQLAEESGAEWSRVHWSVGPHLDQMLAYCHGKGWPLLPSIVVAQAAGETGRLRGSSLDGFANGCRRLGLDLPQDLEAFADAEQDRVFAWASRQDDQAR